MGMGHMYSLRSIRLDRFSVPFAIWFRYGKENPAQERGFMLIVTIATGAIRCTLIGWWRTGYNLRNTVTTLPIIVACVPVDGASMRVIAASIRHSRISFAASLPPLASSSSRAATISPLTAEFLFARLTP